MILLITQWIYVLGLIDFNSNTLLSATIFLGLCFVSIWTYLASILLNSIKWISQTNFPFEK